MTSPSESGDGVLPAQFRAAGYRRLLAAARRSMESSGGSLDKSVTLASPDDDERKVIIGITGKYRDPASKKVTVSLAELDAAVREAGAGSLADLLAAYGGTPLRNRPAERQRVAAGVAAAGRVTQASTLASQQWYAAWAGELRADGMLTRLVNSGEASRVAQAVAVLEAMRELREPVLLQALAAEVTGDAHALDAGRALSTLVLRALALRRGCGRPVSAEDRRDLWDAFDVIVDDLASRVLVLGLRGKGTGLGEWLSGAAALGVPFYVTLQQLVAMPVEFGALEVHVCENPGVLRAAAGSLGASCRPLACTEGRPSTAFHRLAAAITASGGRLRYHGDFDWPGISIATSVMTRHDAAPWRMSAADYRRGVRADGDCVPLSGPPQPTPWDEQLAAAMTQAGCAVYEESVAAALLADLAGQQAPGAGWEAGRP